MVARVTLAEIDSVRTSVARAIEHYEETILPDLRDQRGYEGCFVMTTPAGKALVFTLWEDESSADASAANGAYAARVSEFLTLIRSTPGRETYDVDIADLHAIR